MPVMVDRLYLIGSVTWLHALQKVVLGVTSEPGIAVLTNAAAFLAAVFAPAGSLAMAMTRMVLTDGWGAGGA